MKNKKEKNSSKMNWGNVFVGILMGLVVLVFGWKIHLDKNELPEPKMLDQYAIDEMLSSKNNSEGVNTSVYEGTLPCADCEGILTTLSLNEDKSFTKISEYLGETEVENTFTDEGTYEMTEDENGKYIKLSGEDGKTYKILDENTLTMLDTEGNVVESDLAESYKLMKK